MARSIADRGQVQRFEHQMTAPGPQPGDVLLGKYRLERVIGVGGMGSVVAARHLQLDEPVAIKFLQPALLVQADLVQRFVREARATIKIRSEHCVRVLDVGTLENGAPYMVMEYLQGADLATIVEQGPLPIAEAVDWLLQASEALAEAHALGIVHRDLKPANMFLTRRADGSSCVKVLDFGISKQAVGVAEAAVTATHAVMGSPRYMSPEQMRSTRDVDARTDVWALGAVLHELISGVPAFNADTVPELYAMILQDAPAPLRKTRPDVPPALETAILGALEKERARRYPNVAVFAAAIARFGSPAALSSAERIARVLGMHGASSIDSPRWPSASQRVHTETLVAPGYGTAPAMSLSLQTVHKPGRHARGLLWIALAIAVCSAAVVAVVLRARSGSTEPAAQASPPPVLSAVASGTAASVPSPKEPDIEPATSGRVTATASGLEPSVDSHVQTTREPKPTRSPGPRKPGAATAPSAQPIAPPVAAPGKPAPLPSNPFGDDRKG